MSQNLIHVAAQGGYHGGGSPRRRLSENELRGIFESASRYPNTNFAPATAPSASKSYVRTWKRDPAKWNSSADSETLCRRIHKISKKYRIRRRRKNSTGETLTTQKHAELVYGTKSLTKSQATQLGIMTVKYHRLQNGSIRTGHNTREYPDLVIDIKPQTRYTDSDSAINDLRDTLNPLDDWARERFLTYFEWRFPGKSLRYDPPDLFP